MSFKRSISYLLLAFRGPKLLDESKQSNCRFSNKKLLCFLISIIGSSSLYIILTLSPNSLLQQRSLSPITSWLQKDSSACLLPKLDPFDPSIQKYFTTPPQNYNCTNKYLPLFYTDYNSNLIVNMTLQSTKFSKCCYKHIVRGGIYFDEDFKFSKICFSIDSNITAIPKTVDYIAVFCHDTLKNKSVMVDAFGFINIKPKLEDKMKNISQKFLSTTKFKPDEQASVVVLGLDAVSHMNFIRSLQKTFSFITKDLSALGMHGYTKIGDSTYPNLYAALLGLNDYQLGKCTSNGFFDRCPLIWKKFASAGYRTVFIEDAPDAGTFNSYQGGFIWPPTDYYFRPLMKASHTNLKNAAITGYYPICYGPRTAFETILDTVKKAAFTFGNDKRYFQFVWSSTLSHDYVNNVKIGDEYLYKTVKWLNDGNYLNKTILILMSDHGMRYGDIRSAYQGSVEERMPYVYMVFPKWFSEKYSSAVKNFRINSQRLTTPFDLHETLSDLSNFRNIEDKEIKKRSQELLNMLNIRKKNSTIKNKLRGISLFLPVPLTRNCEHAHIPAHYCVCHAMKSVRIKNNPGVWEMGNAVVGHINNILANYSQCSKLVLKNITRVQQPASSNWVIDWKQKRVHNIINIVTSPGNGNFEATAIRKSLPKGPWIISDDISRTNRYGNASACVTQRDLKKLCHCL